MCIITNYTKDEKSASTCQRVPLTIITLSTVYTCPLAKYYSVLLQNWPLNLSYQLSDLCFLLKYRNSICNRSTLTAKTYMGKKCSCLYIAIGNMTRNVLASVIKPHFKTLSGGECEIVKHHTITGAIGRPVAI